MNCITENTTRGQRKRGLRGIKRLSLGICILAGSCQIRTGSVSCVPLVGCADEAVADLHIKNDEVAAVAFVAASIWQQSPP